MLSDATKTKYANHIKQMDLYFNYKIPLNNPLKIIRYINKLNLSDDSKISYLSAFYTLIDESEKYPYQNLFDKLKKKIEKKKELKTETDNLKMSYSHLEKYIESMDSGIGKVMLMLQFYNTKRSDWKDLKIKNYDKTKDNYIDFENKNLVFNHRTKNTKGIIEKISNNVFIELMMYINTLKPEQEYLFLNSKGNVMSSNNFNKVFQKWSNKLTLNDFRHIIITNFLNSEPTLKERRLFAEKVGHTIETSFSYKRNEE